METRYLTKNTEYVVIDGRVARVIDRLSCELLASHKAVGRRVECFVHLYPIGACIPIAGQVPTAGDALVFERMGEETNNIVTSRLVQDPVTVSS